jgi:serine phosphatase RsbU (regulator of sigma subunit)
MEGDGERMLSGILKGSHLAAFEDLPALVAEHARAAGISQTTIYVSDLQQRILVPLPGQRSAHGLPLRPFRIDGTMAGRAYRNAETVRSHAAAPGEPVKQPVPEGGKRLWVPLLDGTERLGVLGVTVREDDEHAVTRVRHLASLVALLLVSKRATSDAYARLPRTAPMALPAEMTWGLLPSRTFATRNVVISAVMEPAYRAGGDAYDYALDGDTLHLAVFDAMGHDTAAGLTSAIAMGSARNSRRRGAGLSDVVDAVDEAVAEQFDEDRFVTGIMADLDTHGGRLTWINRAHPAPLVIRRGRHVASLGRPPHTPMGYRLERRLTPAGYQLEPGDRLVFYTDGIVEARSPEGEPFGPERFADFIIRREADGLSAPETLRRLIQTVMAHQGDRLQDDATVLLVEWHARADRLLA